MAVLRQMAQLALLPPLIAVVGFLLGRMLRGRRPAIEMARPRIAVSSAYLRDAHDKSLSAHTRIRCAFESIYFCLAETAESNDVNVASVTHPSASIAERGMTAISATAVDRETVRALVVWAASMSPAMPETSPDEACLVAERMRAATISLLTSTDRFSATPTDRS